jgi:hypothetical protein
MMTGPDLLRAFLRDLDRLHADVAEADRERRAADLEAECDAALAPLLEGLDLVDAGDLVDIDPDDLPAHRAHCADCDAPLVDAVDLAHGSLCSDCLEWERFCDNSEDL